jgi:hypothetical protein
MSFAGVLLTKCSNASKVMIVKNVLRRRDKILSATDHQGTVSALLCFYKRDGGGPIPGNWADCHGPIARAFNSHALESNVQFLD